MSKASHTFEAAISELERVLGQSKSGDQMLANIVTARDEVLPRYQAVFSSGNLASLSEEEFRQFLQFRNNRHWVALQRMGPAICADMDRLRKALAILLDESRPIESRLDELVPDRGHAFVPRLGKAVLTPILLICHPEKYGVWNRTSEAGMKALDVWPDFARSDTFGHRYREVDRILGKLAAALKIDLWTLDALWWRIRSPFDGDDEVPDDEAETEDVAHRFGMERHLQEFLRDNWDRTSLGKEWKLHEEHNEPDAGYEYPCSVGRIDLLARHRKDGAWLVVELKRNQSSDQTVGQVLRYMGWVRKNLAQAGERVEGLVIAREADDSIKYALSTVPDVRLQLYEVEFRLQNANLKLE